MEVHKMNEEETKVEETKTDEIIKQNKRVIIIMG